MKPNTSAMPLAIAGLIVAMMSAVSARAEEVTYTVRLLTPETALKAAQAALARCRTQGYQVAVAVVDRNGLPQVMLRDRFAGAHTPDAAVSKAWTAVSFRTPTTELAAETQAGRPQSGIRHIPRVAAVGGGMLIEAGGSIIGGIAVSGGPGAAADDLCAKAGIAAIQESLEF